MNHGYQSFIQDNYYGDRKKKFNVNIRLDLKNNRILLVSAWMLNIVSIFHVVRGLKKQNKKNLDIRELKLRINPTIATPAWRMVNCWLNKWYNNMYIFFNIQSQPWSRSTQYRTIWLMMLHWSAHNLNKVREPGLR